MTFLTKAEDVFEVRGRGAVLLIPKHWGGSKFRIRPGDKIQLRTPAGRVFDTCIKAIELVTGTGGSQAAIMLPREIQRSDLSAQTEIWLSER